MAAGNHSPTNPLDGCQCGICTTPTEPLTEREEKELATYLRMAFTGTRPPWDEPWEEATDDQEDREFEDGAIRFSHSTRTSGDRYVVTEDALHDIYLALRSPDPERVERVRKDVMVLMRESREEKKEKPVA